MRNNKYVAPFFSLSFFFFCVIEGGYPIPHQTVITITTATTTTTTTTQSQPHPPM